MERTEAALRAALAGPLPGPSAQRRLAPRPRTGWVPGRIPEDCRPSACLILLYPHENRPHLLLTVRQDDLPHHAGQVSFPGGAVEAGESCTEAALREAAEEANVDPQAVLVLGELSPLHIPVSRFVLHPVVALAGRRPRFRAQPSEVHRILEVPLERLASPEVLRSESRSLRGQQFEVPYLEVEGHKVWGATAMVLAELLELLDSFPDPSGRA